MNVKLLYVIFLLLFFGCSKSEKTVPDNQLEPLTSRISVGNSDNSYDVKSGKFTYHFPLSKIPVRRVIVLNASLVGYFTELGLEDKIVGVSSPEYIYSEKIKQRLADGRIHNVGNEQKYDLEKIVALMPDLIVTTHISTFENTYDTLRRLTSAEILFLDEYLEPHPLDKSRYLLIFGKLLGKETFAREKYESIAKNYQDWSALAQKQPKKPMVIANEIYGNQWFMPGGKTQFAQFVKDAGGNYLLRNDESEKAVPLSFEEVLVQSEQASVWLNAGNHRSRAGLLAVNANYAKLPVFQQGRIFSVGAKQKDKANDFFESGTVRADLILRDYIKILHLQLFPDAALTFQEELR